MAIEEETLFNTYDPNGATTSFAYGFTLFNEEDLEVLADGVAITTGFTVNGVGDQGGGTVVFDTAPASTVAELTLRLSPSFSRVEEDYAEGDLRAASLNRDFDRMWQALQYNRQENNVAIKLPLETQAAQEITETAAQRANKLVGFDASGNIALLDAVDYDLSTVSAFAATLLDDTTASAARTTLGISSAAVTQDGLRYTTAGTAPAFTITPSPVLSSYSAGQRFTVVFNADGTEGSNTLNANGLGAKSLKQYDGAGNKRSGIVKSSQIAVVEYDGTDMVILNPLRLEPVSMVRQTVQSGPVSSGSPNFLPSTATGLSITSQNVSTSDPLIVCASQGYGNGSDRIGVSTSNLTWSGLTNTTTNYLYVVVGSDGTLTTGSTTIAPVYQYSGTPSTTNTTHTFDITKYIMYVGNGSTAPAAWRVFVGEAVCSGGNVTSATAYAYNGIYLSPDSTPVASGVFSAVHNLGVKFYTSRVVLACAVAEYGYAVGDEIEPSAHLHTTAAATAYGYTQIYGPMIHRVQLAPGTSPLRANSLTATGTPAATVPASSVGASASLTLASWRFRAYITRAF